ncbi:MAG: Hsp20/alpha crystallin family protein, partial [Deltaproteobacteria bacterium]|nr:Hsp20/alpha crystallin family protein [Deltaproteobacteria bacterium]
QVRHSLGTLLQAHQTSVSFRPAADFYETTRGLVLRLELAGVASEDVSLILTGHELVVRGRRRPPPPEGIRRFVHLEMAFGIFERRFMLPIAVDPQRVEASYVDGVLEVHLPRKAPQTRTIPVKVEPVGE